MISCIIFCSLLLISIILLIMNCIKHFENDTLGIVLIMFGILTLIFMFVFLISLNWGYSNNSYEYWLKEKELLELRLKYGELNDDLIKEVTKYNASFDSYNNLWCRFNVEDRSDLYINIFNYLKR